MQDEPTSLDRLHDIATPAPISWWPLAPGWIALGFLLLAIMIWISIRRIHKWRSNAYRRAALREIGNCKTAVEIATVLRRTALAIAPRKTIAHLNGTSWADWLITLTHSPPSQNVQNLISRSIYQRRVDAAETEAFRRFAIHWITSHRIPC